jgi:hypothetical protein
VSWDGLWTPLLGSHNYMVTALGSSVKWALGLHHTMAKGHEAVNFHQLDCKKPRIQPLDPYTLEAKVQRPEIPTWQHFDQGNGPSKEVWVGCEWKPKL